MDRPDEIYNLMNRNIVYNLSRESKIDHWHDTLFTLETIYRVVYTMIIIIIIIKVLFQLYWGKPLIHSNMRYYFSLVSPTQYSAVIG